MRLGLRLGTVMVATIATGLALSACGDDEPAPGTAPPSTSVSSVGPPEAEGDGPPTSTCQGTPGDGNGAELSTVEVKRLGGNLQVTYQLESALPDGDTILYTVDAWDLDGELGHQLAVEIDRRGELTPYVLTYPEETTTEVQGFEVETTDTTLVATYPLDMLRSLGDEFKWSATVKIGADPADSCPAVGDDPLDPERVLYPE